MAGRLLEQRRGIWYEWESLSAHQAPLASSRMTLSWREGTRRVCGKKSDMIGQNQPQNEGLVDGNRGNQATD